MFFSQRATSILRESLEAKVEVFGDLSPEVAETYQLLGRADLAQGNRSGAHKKLKKVKLKPILMQRKAFPPSRRSRSLSPPCSF